MNTKKNVQIIQPTIGLEAQKIIRVAAYCRVSTDSEDQADSFLAQVKYYNEFIKAQNNMTLVDIYADEGITGTCMNKREEFKRLIKDCTLGRIDKVLVKSVSRFARNSLECLETIRKLKECGVSVVFENDNIDTKTMNSELILYVKSAFAQSEALAGSRRVSTAYRMKMENGTFLTYCAPFGYRLENQRLVIEPTEAEIVKRIFNLYLSGSGINTIAAIMNREAVAGKAHWSTTMVKYLLTNEKYIGDSKLVNTIRVGDYDLGKLNDAINQVSDYDFAGEIEGFNKFGFWKTIEEWDLDEMSDDMKALITNIIVYGREHFKGEDLAVFLYRILDGTIDFSE